MCETSITVIVKFHATLLYVKTSVHKALSYLKTILTQNIFSVDSELFVLYLQEKQLIDLELDVRNVKMDMSQVKNAANIKSCRGSGPAGANTCFDQPVTIHFRRLVLKKKSSIFPSYHRNQMDTNLEKHPRPKETRDQFPDF